MDRQKVLIASERFMLLLYFALVLLILFKKVSVNEFLFIIVPIPYLALRIYNISKYRGGNYMVMGSFVLIHFFMVYRIYHNS